MAREKFRPRCSSWQSIRRPSGGDLPVEGEHQELPLVIRDSVDGSPTGRAFEAFGPATDGVDALKNGLFQGIYAISGGTKRFKGATGGGAVNGIAYNQGQFLMFTLHGKIAP